MKPKLLVWDYNVGYAEPFVSTFDILRIDNNLSPVGNIKAADVLLFTGGEDISPSLYGHHKLNTTYVNKERDNLEEIIFSLAIEHKKGVLGICRGAQLACAMAGGELVQHCTGHSGRGGHYITTNELEEIYMTSLHHQMMVPGKAKHVLLAWSEKLSDEYHFGYEVSRPDKIEEVRKDRVPYKDDLEPEVVFFEDIRALGIQGHPEMLPQGPHQKTLDWCNKVAKEYLS